MLLTTSLKNQMNWSQHMFQTVEGNEIKEEISEDFLEGLNELDQEEKRRIRGDHFSGIGG